MKRKAFLVGLNRYPDPRNNLMGIDGDDHGALTYYLWRSLMDAKWQTSYRKLIAATGASLADRNYDQVPQLKGPSKLLSAGVFTAGSVG